VYWRVVFHPFFCTKKVVDKFFTRASIFLFLAIIQARTGFSTLTSVSFFSSADNKYHERTPISRTSRRLNGARLLAVSCTGQPALVEEFSGLTWLVLVGRKDKLLALIKDGNG
jgi:hypothetical protein